MRFPSLVRGEFVARDNRFRATVLVEGLPTAAHVPTSGRLAELLTPGRTVWLTPQSHAGRKTAYDLTLVQHGVLWVCVDARVPNALVAEHLQRVGWQGRPVSEVQREVRLGGSRLDLLVRDDDGSVWMEVKSVTLVVDGLALFPDAPTTRGARHLEELTEAAARGERTAAVFVAQRGDAQRFGPHRAADPVFAEALARAAHAGVQLCAYACQVSPQSITIVRPIPVELL